MGIVLVPKKVRERLKRKEQAINRDLKKYGFSISDLLPNITNWTFTIVPGDGSRRLTKKQEGKLRDVLRKHIGQKNGGAR